MNAEQAAELIAALKSIHITLGMLTFWVALILFFKDCSGK